MCDYMELQLPIAGAISACPPDRKDAGSLSDIYCDLLEHELLNLNQIAIGYLELSAGLQESGMRQVKNSSDLILKSVGALKYSSMLIGGFRKLREAKAGCVTVEQVNVAAALSELKDRYSQLPGRAISVACECQAGGTMYADGAIRDIFSCLIWGAIRRSCPDWPLEIRLGIGEIWRKAGKYYRITVEDNGPGIRDEQKARLFSDCNADTAACGAGLGLCIVRTLVDRCHGRVWVENRVREDYAKGSKFVVLLPASDISGGQINRL